MVPKGQGVGCCHGEDALRNGLYTVPCHSATLLGVKSLTLTRVAPVPEKLGCPINTRARGEGWSRLLSRRNARAGP